MAVGAGRVVVDGAAGRADAPPVELVALCRHEHPRLVGALGLYTGDRELAEELAQEAMLRLCQHWERVSVLESPGGWVHRVAINLANSAHRRRRVASSAAARLTRAAEQEPASDIGLVVRSAVASLPEEMREVIVLRYYLDLPVAEVAALLGRPEGTVKALTSRAIAKLRARGLAGLFEEPHAD